MPLYRKRWAPLQISLDKRDEMCKCYQLNKLKMPSGAVLPNLLRFLATRRVQTGLVSAEFSAGCYVLWISSGARPESPLTIAVQSPPDLAVLFGNGFLRRKVSKRPLVRSTSPPYQNGLGCLGRRTVFGQAKASPLPPLFIPCDHAVLHH